MKLLKELLALLVYAAVVVAAGLVIGLVLVVLMG